MVNDGGAAAAVVMTVVMSEAISRDITMSIERAERVGGQGQAKIADYSVSTWMSSEPINVTF